MGDIFAAFKSFPVILDVFVGRYASNWFVVDRCGIDIYMVIVDRYWSFWVVPCFSNYAVYMQSI